MLLAVSDRRVRKLLYSRVMKLKNYPGELWVHDPQLLEKHQ